MQMPRRRGAEGAHGQNCRVGCAWSPRQARGFTRRALDTALSHHTEPSMLRKCQGTPGVPVQNIALRLGAGCLSQQPMSLGWASSSGTRGFRERGKRGARPRSPSSRPALPAPIAWTPPRAHGPPCLPPCDCAPAPSQPHSLSSPLLAG